MGDYGFMGRDSVNKEAFSSMAAELRARIPIVTKWNNDKSERHPQYQAYLEIKK